MQDVRIVPFESKYYQPALQFDGRPSLRRARKLLMVQQETQGFYGYVALVGEELVGFIIMEDLGDGVSYYMEQINVREKREKIGTKLVRHVFESLGKGAHISLCVNTDNEAAIRFYRSLGFWASGFTAGYRKHQDKLWYQIDL